MQLLVKIVKQIKEKNSNIFNVVDTYASEFYKYI